MKLIAPETAAADQEGFDLSPFIIENITVPVRMIPLTHIGILIGIGAIEHIETMCVVGKVRGYPVQQHPNTRFMKGTHQFHERLRIAKPGCRCKITDALITPASVI